MIHVSYSLNSFNFGAYIGVTLYSNPYIGVITGGTRSLDYSSYDSYDYWVLPPVSKSWSTNFTVILYDS